MNNLESLTKAANGMLPAEVYQAIFDTVSASKCENIVEVGTAHGAATIALALGAVARGGPSTIWTIDRLGGSFSSRSAYGSPSENERIVMTNISRAKVDHLIRLFVGSSDEFHFSGQCPDKIDLLMLDADGRIDRDLAYFYPRMAQGASIIIDDVDRRVFLNRNYEGMPYIDNKHRLTSLLLASFVQGGYLNVVDRIADTAFCQRTGKPFDPVQFLQLALQSYRELTFVDVDDVYWRELAAWNDSRVFVRQAMKFKKVLPAPLIELGMRLRRKLIRVCR